METPLVIVNPVSGPAAQRTLEQHRLARSLAAAGMGETWHETSLDRDAGDIVADHPGDSPVVVVGGDGTIRNAVRELRGSERPLLIVPRGSGNILAHRFHIPNRLGAALDLLREGTTRSLDVGVCDGEPFLLAVGVGIDARVMREADRRLKQQVGKLAYIWGAARNLPIRHHDFDLEIDGRSDRVRACSVMVTNVGTYIGPWLYPPRSDACDGQLDATMMRAETLQQVLDLLATPFFREDMPNRGVEVRRGRRIVVEASEEIPLQIDGDALGSRHRFCCEIEPAALRLVVPRD
jgi:diacylglycerol kinase family enzyme